MVITTTLSNLSTPRPLATIPIILSTYETMTTVASNALKMSHKNIKLLANVFNTISVKNKARNTLSIEDNKLSDTPNMSAKVSWKSTNIVYKLMRIILPISKVVDSRVFRQKP